MPSSSAGQSDRADDRSTIHALQAVNRLFAQVYHRIETLSPCRLPRSGPAIVICNHTSGLDPHLIQSACPRLITWMMAREYYNTPFLRRILDHIGVIPVTRGARDTTATRAALRALERGQVLGIFPEGGIEKTDELDPFQPGVAMMALKTGAPVFPAYLDGTQRGCSMLEGFFRPHQAILVHGEQVVLDCDSNDRDKLTKATKRMENAVESLRQFARKARPRRNLR